MSKSKVLLGILGLGLSTAALSIPMEIQFTNDTPIALSTEVAGLPGRGIEANISKSVFVGIVQIACNSANSMSDCPLTFFNKATGEEVARVRMNVNNFTLTAPPVLFGDYADKFVVSGWESSPISHIKISEK